MASDDDLSAKLLASAEDIHEERPRADSSVGGAENDESLIETNERRAEGSSGAFPFDNVLNFIFVVSFDARHGKEEFSAEIHSEAPI